MKDSSYYSNKTQTEINNYVEKNYQKVMSKIEKSIEYNSNESFECDLDISDLFSGYYDSSSIKCAAVLNLVQKELESKGFKVNIRKKETDYYDCDHSFSYVLNIKW